MERLVVALAFFVLATSTFSQSGPEMIGGGWLHSVTTDAMTDETQSIFTVGSVDGTSTIGFTCTNTNLVSKLMVRLPDAIKPTRKSEATVLVRETHSLEPRTVAVKTAKAGKWIYLPTEYLSYFLTTRRLVIRYTNTTGKVRTLEFANPVSPIPQVRKECSNRDFLMFLEDMEKIDKGLSQ